MLRHPGLVDLRDDTVNVRRFPRLHINSPTHCSDNAGPESESGIRKLQVSGRQHVTTGSGHGADSWMLATVESEVDVIGRVGRMTVSRLAADAG
jgi:hypothetical protein